MLLHGSIQRFNMADILRFLAQIAATGVLEVRDFEEYGFIYFFEGHVEGISLPLMGERLGTRLVKAGYLSQWQLADALMEDSAYTHDQKKFRPLGERLLEKGLATEAAVREVMGIQLLDQVFELAHWRNGVFIYDEPEQMPHFQIAIQGNVQELLFAAQRRIEEGEQARKSGGGHENEVCHACPIERECTAAIKVKYLKLDVCLWRKMSAVVDDQYDRLRDARQLYRSKDKEVKTDLNPSLWAR